MKLKKLLAAVTAAALAVTTMAVTSFTASAATEPLHTWTSESGGAGADEYKVNLNADGITPSDVKGVSMTFTGATTDYVKLTPITNFQSETGDASSNGYNNQNSFALNIVNGAATLDITFGTTEALKWNATTESDDTVINDLNFPVSSSSYGWAELLISVGYMNAGSISLESVTLKNAGGTTIKTYVGEEISSGGNEGGGVTVNPPSGSGLKTWSASNYGDDTYDLNLMENNVNPKDVKKIDLVLSGMSEYGGKIDVASSSTSSSWNDNAFLFNYTPNPQTVSIEFGVTEKAVYDEENNTDIMQPNTLGFTDSEEYAILKFFPSYVAPGEPITLVSITLKDASGNVLLTVPGSGEEEGGMFDIYVEWDNLVVGESSEAYAYVTYTEDGTTVDVANSVDNAEDFSWTIENESVATVSENGVFTAVAPGRTNFHVMYFNENIEDGFIDLVDEIVVTAESAPAPAPSTPSTSTSTTSPNPAPVSSTTVVDMILATPDGGNGTVTLGSSTKLDKVAMEALATKGDVTVKFNVAGGAYWEINGSNVTDAKAVDLGVKVNSNLIPESKVSEFAGDKTTVQLTLRHNGDFGFTGTLCVPVGKANNGKFANLYYYHGGQFDFVGSSAISGGMTKFAFSHASNYLIVIDDYAYGEDVSSAAGMTETAAETSTVPYVAVLVVISAFGASAIVLKKRLSK
ncbi:MAG: hypothetical protein HDT25_08690 [Ruminococcus sp.]|nr:hypothetical protein [Ruminococcus sp.]